MNSIKKQARFAGLLYLLACLPAPFALIYVPSKLVVSGDAMATAERVRSSETLLRMGIAGELINSIVVIFAVLAFYRLLKRVSESQALAMLILLLASIPISLLNVLNEIATLVLARGGGFLSVFDQRQLDALAYLFMRLHNQGLVIAAIFWGLWLFPLGILMIRSGFIPRLVGVFAILAGVLYLVAGFTTLVLPQYAYLSRFLTVLEFGEVPMLLWLLIWGANEQSSMALSADQAIA
jgi:hypothetical protein